jgi:hypothetical protein
LTIGAPPEKGIPVGSEGSFLIGLDDTAGCEFVTTWLNGNRFWNHQINLANSTDGWLTHLNRNEKNEAIANDFILSHSVTSIDLVAIVFDGVFHDSEDVMDHQGGLSTKSRDFGCLQSQV